MAFVVCQDMRFFQQSLVMLKSVVLFSNAELVFHVIADHGFHTKFRSQVSLCWSKGSHYENTPIQMYWKFYHQKMKIFRWKILIFFTFLLKI